MDAEGMAGKVSLFAATLLALGLSLAIAACATPRQRPEPAAIGAKAELPPHVVEVAQGLYSCERGYLIRQGRCIPFEELEHGPVVEISSLPSAGEGAGGGRLCPSGGCGSYVTPSYSTFVYSGAGFYDYRPDLYYGGHGGWRGVPHARRFRAGEPAAGGRLNSFVQERRYEAWKSSFPGAPRRHSSGSDAPSLAQGSQATARAAGDDAAEALEPEFGVRNKPSLDPAGCCHEGLPGGGTGASRSWERRLRSRANSRSYGTFSPESPMAGNLRSIQREKHT